MQVLCTTQRKAEGETPKSTIKYESRGAHRDSRVVGARVVEELLDVVDEVLPRRVPAPFSTSLHRTNTHFLGIFFRVDIPASRCFSLQLPSYMKSQGNAAFATCMR